MRTFADEIASDTGAYCAWSPLGSRAHPAKTKRAHHAVANLKDFHAITELIASPMTL